MKTASFFLLSILFVLSIISPLQSQWIKTNIDKNTVHYLSATNSAIFAGVSFTAGSTIETGVLVSTDGITFNATSWYTSYCPPLASIGNATFASECNNDNKHRPGITTNNGEYWSFTGAGLNGASVVKFKVAGNYLFATATDGKFYRTNDNGVSWQEITNLPKTPGQIAASETLVFAYVENNGLYRSLDYGDSWTLVYQPTNKSKAIFVLENKVYFLNDGLAVSTNNGDTWSIVNDTVSAIRSMINIDGNLFAATEQNGVIRSIDAGKSWTKIYDSGMNWCWDLAVFNSNLFVCGDAFGIVRRPLSEIVTAIDTTTTTSVEKSNSKISDFELSQNYPNPFNPSTTIEYKVKKSGLVTVKIYNILGNTIATLVNEKKSVGTYSVTWQPSNVASGVYFYRLETESFSISRKLIYAK
ncbi:MAG: T9SS type A sorting domain-containing protein [Clostridia bacterium]|jgi:hypothetical protein